MRKIIRGKVYDTATAKMLGYDSRGEGFSHWEETLYVKRTGEYFLHGSGGAASKYSKREEDTWFGDEDIIPLSIQKAKTWAESHLTPEDYATAFGMPDEGDDLETLCVQLPAQMMTKIRVEASSSGQSLKDYVTGILSKTLS